jgi:hypothetical protein
MQLGSLILSGLLLAVAVYVGGWISIGILNLKQWICDKEIICCCDTPIAKSNHEIFGHEYPTDFATEWFLTCFLLCVALVILAGVCYFPIGRAIVLGAVGITVLIFIGSHALRWAMRTKKALAKVRKMAHEHEEV